MKIYTLCVGEGADAGDWPCLGDWYVSDDFQKIVTKAKELGLNTEVWRNLDGEPYAAFKSQPDSAQFPETKEGPGEAYSCWAYADDSDEDHERDLYPYADAVAKVYVHETL